MQQWSLLVIDNVTLLYLQLIEKGLSLVPRNLGISPKIRYSAIGTPGQPQTLLGAAWRKA